MQLKLKTKFIENGFSSDTLSIANAVVHGANIRAFVFQHQARLTRTHLHKGYVDTAKIIGILACFCEAIEQTAFVVLDHASCNTGTTCPSYVKTGQREMLADLLPATLQS